jgi:hypothetical protein
MKVLEREGSRRRWIGGSTWGNSYPLVTEEVEAGRYNPIQNTEHNTMNGY